MDTIWNIFSRRGSYYLFAFEYWFKHILLARTVDIIEQMLTILKLQGLEWKQHAYIIPFLHLTILTPVQDISIVLPVTC